MDRRVNHQGREANINDSTNGDAIGHSDTWNSLELRDRWRNRWRNSSVGKIDVRRRSPDPDSDWPRTKACAKKVTPYYPLVNTTKKSQPGNKIIREVEGDNLQIDTVIGRCEDDGISKNSKEGLTR